MNTPHSTSQVDHVVESLVDIGATWARYGLTIGKSALETSAKTLSTTADLLGNLARQFEHTPASKGGDPTSNQS